MLMVRQRAEPSHQRRVRSGMALCVDITLREAYSLAATQRAKSSVPSCSRTAQLPGGRNYDASM